MSTTHQIYHTHCTYGSSAVDRATGETADIPKGYGIRAGSLGDRELADAGRQLDSWMAYRLPPGTPPGDNLKIAPEKAPRALVYAAQVGSYEAIGQVSHRGTDSSGQRPGCYFAHVIFHDRSEASWGPLEALKLFAAPGWVMRDAPGLPHRIPVLAGPGAILDRNVPVVDDTVLLGFLTDASNPADPARLIPKRWREKPAEERLGLLLDLMSGYLAVQSTPGKVCLLAAEPGFAALLFYGVCRLLPPALLADVSFNTYDSEPLRRRSRLAATDLREPRTDELPTEFIDSMSELALNTYSNKRSKLKPDADYARLALRTLTTEGYAGLDGLLRRLHALGAQSGTDLNAAAAALLILPKVLDPVEDNVKPIWRQQPLAAKVLGDAVVARLSGPAGQVHRQSLIGRPAQLRALEIACGIGASGVELRGQLLQTLPLDMIGPSVLLDTVPEAAKVERLAHYAQQRGQLPPGSEAFWARDANRSDSPLAKLVELIPAAVVTRLVTAGLDSRYVPALLGRLFGASENAKRDIARNYLTSHLNKIDDVGLCQLLNSPEGAALVAKLPASNHPVGPRGQAMLDDLPTLLDSKVEFDERLDAIDQAEGYLGDEYVERLNKWKSCKQLLSEVAKGADSKYADPARDLGLAFRAAYGAIDTANGDARVRALKRFMEAQLAEHELVDPADWKTIRYCCDIGVPPKYSQRPRAKSTRRTSSGTPAWLIVSGVGGGLAVAGLLIVGIKIMIGPAAPKSLPPPPVVVAEPPPPIEEPVKPVIPTPRPKVESPPIEPKRPRTLADVRADLDGLRKRVSEADTLVAEKKAWIAKYTNEADLVTQLESILEIAASPSTRPDFYLKLPVLRVDATRFEPGDANARRPLVLKLSPADGPDTGRALGSGYVQAVEVDTGATLELSESDSVKRAAGAAFNLESIGIKSFDEPVVCSLSLTAKGTPPRTIELRINGRLEKDKANTLRAKAGTESDAANLLNRWFDAASARVKADGELRLLDTALATANRTYRQRLIALADDICRGEEAARAAVAAASPSSGNLEFAERELEGTETQRLLLHDKLPFGPAIELPAKSTITWAIQYYLIGIEKANTIDRFHPSSEAIAIKTGGDHNRSRLDLHFRIVEPQRQREVSFVLAAPERGWMEFNRLKKYVITVTEAPVLKALADWLDWLQIERESAAITAKGGA